MTNKKYKEMQSPDGSISFIRPIRWYEKQQVGDLIGIAILAGIIATVIIITS
jgi:hypothetical protein